MANSLKANINNLLRTKNINSSPSTNKIGVGTEAANIIGTGDANENNSGINENTGIVILKIARSHVSKPNTIGMATKVRQSQ